MQDDAPVHRRTLRVDDLELSYLEAGDGPPVLLLHGWPTQAALWRHVLPALGRTHRAIALDLPGFGESSKPADASYSFRFHGRVLTGLLDALGLDEIGLVVHDLGGPIGLHWACEHPERIRELVLLNTIVFPDMSWAVKLFVASTMMPGVRRALSSPWGIEQAMRFGVSDKGRIQGEVAAMYRRPFIDRNARKALLKAGHGLHPKGFDTLSSGLASFADRPCFLLYGEDDRILPRVADTMSRVKAILPQAELHAIANCGHFLQEDRPDQVAALLAAFFARTLETPGQD